MSLYGGQPLILGLQFLLQFVDTAIANLGNLVQLTLPLRDLLFAACVINLCLETAYCINAFFFHTPLRLFGAQTFAQVGHFRFNGVATFLAHAIFFFFQGQLLYFQLAQATLNNINFIRHAVKINCLVRQKAVGNIAVAEYCGGNKGIVPYTHAVMYLIPFFQSPQNGNGVFHIRLGDQNRLKTAFQCRIFLHMLLILVKGGRADAVQFTTGQCRLEHVGGVHGAFCRTCAHDGVHLIYEKDYGASGFLHRSKYRLEPLFKFATKFRACHHGGNVECGNALVFQAFRHIPGDNALGESLHNGRLARSGFANQYRIVLSAAGQYLYNPTYLFITPDDRIKFSCPRQLSQITAVLLQRLVSGLCIGVIHTLCSAHLLHCLQHRLGGNAHAFQQLGGITFGFQNAQQNVFCTQVLILQTLRLFPARVQRLIRITA